MHCCCGNIVKTRTWINTHWQWNPHKNYVDANLCQQDTVNNLASPCRPKHLLTCLFLHPSVWKSMRDATLLVQSKEFHGATLLPRTRAKSARNQHQDCHLKRRSASPFQCALIFNPKTCLWELPIHQHFLDFEEGGVLDTRFDRFIFCDPNAICAMHAMRLAKFTHTFSTNCELMHVNKISFDKYLSGIALLTCCRFFLIHISASIFDNAANKSSHNAMGNFW